MGVIFRGQCGRTATLREAGTPLYPGIGRRQETSASGIHKNRYFWKKAYVGDDVNDLAPMRIGALLCSSERSHQDVLRQARLIPRSGRWESSKSVSM